MLSTEKKPNMPNNKKPIWKEHFGTRCTYKLSRYDNIMFIKDELK